MTSKQRNILKVIQKLSQIVLATICLGSGVAFFLAANLGSNSLTVIQAGMHVILGITYGQACLVYNAVMIIVAFIWARKYFGTGTVVSALLMSIVIDVVYPTIVILLSFIHVHILFISGLCLLIGQILYSYGLSILISCKLGMNSLDSVLTMISKKIDIPYTYLRITADLSLVFIGWMLGGVIGIGTIISILCTGLLVEFFKVKHASS
jgi:uncharacterized membrane protein YczE